MIYMDYDNFFLPVDNIEKAMDYYEEIIGLKLKFNFKGKGNSCHGIWEARHPRGSPHQRCTH